MQNSSQHTHQSGEANERKLLPWWLIAVMAVFLIYMAWYVHLSDGTEYYITSDYEYTEYQTFTNGVFEADLNYPESRMQRLGLQLSAPEETAEDQVLRIELTGNGVDEHWSVQAADVTEGEMLWLYLDYSDIGEGQSLHLRLEVTGEGSGEWRILVGYDPEENAETVAGQEVNSDPDAGIVPEAEQLEKVEIEGEIEGEEESSLTTREDNDAQETEEEISGTAKGVAYCALVERVSKVLIYIAAAAITLLIFVCYAWISFRPSQENLFLALWLMLGMVYMIAQPVFSEADARTHYYRAADVANGRLITEQDEEGNWIGWYAIPEGWYDEGNSSHISAYESLEYLDYSIDEEPTLFTYVNTAVYSPFTYLPQAIGIFVAQLFTNRLMVIVYAGRMTNFLLTGAVYWLAVRLMPFSKKYIIWSALIPMNLHEAVSLAPDAMVSALVALLLAAALSLRYDPKSRLTTPMLALLYITSFLITQDKIVYVGACMLLFLIPASKFSEGKQGEDPLSGGHFPQKPSTDTNAGKGECTKRVCECLCRNRKYLKHVLLLGALILAASLGWLMIAVRGLMGQYSDSHGQLTLLLTRPILFVEAVGRSILYRSGTYLNQMLGEYFGPFLVQNDMVLMYIVLLGMALISLAQFLRKRAEAEHGAEPEPLPRVDWKARGNLLLSSGLMLLLVFMSEYILWTNYMGRYVDGIQGRYFLPVVPLMLCAIFGLQKDDMEQERAQYALLIGLDLCMALNAGVSWLYLTGSTVLF